MFPVNGRSPSGGAMMPPGPMQGGADAPPIPPHRPSGMPPMPSDVTPGAGRPPPQIPPQYQPHVDPNNPVQAELLHRIDALSPADIKAFATGISPAAVMVLKKVLPEFSFLLDRIGGAPAGAPGALPPAGPNALEGARPVGGPPLASGEGGGASAFAPGPMPMRRGPPPRRGPRTKLAGM